MKRSLLLFALCLPYAINGDAPTYTQPETKTVEEGSSAPSKLLVGAYLVPIIVGGIVWNEVRAMKNQQRLHPQPQSRGLGQKVDQIDGNLAGLLARLPEGEGQVPSVQEFGQLRDRLAELAGQRQPAVAAQGQGRSVAELERIMESYLTQRALPLIGDAQRDGGNGNSLFANLQRLIQQQEALGVRLDALEGAEGAAAEVRQLREELGELRGDTQRRLRDLEPKVAALTRAKLRS